MSDTFLRQWAMLQLIPRTPRKIDATSLQQLLEDRGYEVNVRTIQRDLDRLSELFPLVADDRSKPFGWSWSGTEVLDIPGMDPPTALTFAMVSEYLQPLLPRSTLQYLDPHFERARNVLKEADHSNISSWFKKVRILPHGQKLLCPQVEPEVLDGIYESLLTCVRFKGVYQPKDKDELVEYEVNPVGLVVRDSVIYLLASIWGYDNVLQLAVHRFSSVSLLDKPATKINDFDLDTYITEGGFGYRVTEKSLRLKLLFDSSTVKHIIETPLSEDQVTKLADDGRILVQVTVMDTLELRWWLKGFGQEVEVLGPKKLRNEFIEMAEDLSNRYLDAT